MKKSKKIVLVTLGASALALFFAQGGKWVWLQPGGGVSETRPTPAPAPAPSPQSSDSLDQQIDSFQQQQSGPGIGGGSDGGEW